MHSFLPPDPDRHIQDRQVDKLMQDGEVGTYLLPLGVPVTLPIQWKRFFHLLLAVRRLDPPGVATAANFAIRWLAKKDH